jgi:Protein of unknown function (DUF3830)
MNAFLGEGRIVGNPGLDLPLRLDRRQHQFACLGPNRLVRPSSRPGAEAIDAWPKPEPAQGSPPSARRSCVHRASTGQSKVPPDPRGPKPSRKLRHKTSIDFEEKAASKIVAALVKHMPFVSKIIHVRWSGEGVWVPLGDLEFGVSFENNTCCPAPGQVILYPGGVSETELLSAYGNVSSRRRRDPSRQPFPDPHRGHREYRCPRTQDTCRGQQDIRFELDRSEGALDAAVL